MRELCMYGCLCMCMCALSYRERRARRQLGHVDTSPAMAIERPSVVGALQAAIWSHQALAQCGRPMGTPATTETPQHQLQTSHTGSPNVHRVPHRIVYCIVYCTVCSSIKIRSSPSPALYWPLWPGVGNQTLSLSLTSKPMSVR
jgi:hypothetical protein